MSNRLGELLVKASLITPEQLNKALAEQKAAGGRLGFNLTKLGFLNEEALTTFLSKQHNVPAINLSEFEIDPSVIKLIPLDVAKKYLVIPVNRAGSTLILAMSDPSNIFALDDIKFMTGYNVEAVVAAEGSIIEAIKKYYVKGAGSKEEKTLKLDAKDYSLDEKDHVGGFEDELDTGGVVDVEDFDSLVHGAVDDAEVVEETDVTEEALSADVEAPIVKLVNGILIRAAKMGVSDIHIEPYEKSFRVRYRLDGSLKTAMGLPIKIRNAIISRIKIMASLDIAERRLPQDGRIKLKMGAKKTMDFRVSVLPTLFGEKVVMRLLDKSNLQLDMTKLGFGEKQLKDFKDAIHKPFGMVLVTGPTGSGKTTTLYSALSELNKESENIMTAEDPVEFNLQGINQVQMKEDIGLNFAATLRSFLRQDPDIIMVGEIRDFETAEIAIKAALTGHMVLSTLHTNDAPGTINRLLNMGIEPFLVASATNLILAQRLARKTCLECKEPIDVPEQALLDIGVPKEAIGTFTVYKGKGCSNCNNGYKGRIALYEIMPIYEEIKELILNGASTSEIRREAVRLGMDTLRLSGIKKMMDGIITPDEVVRCSVKE
ncbi:MAG: type IV-A pilus assembly ATPase PilB [Deltaproteobacteria bacterium]|nr:type IV-A pilus assembly ATPase PilB [Deltaproteobacteria bacterium]